MLEFVSKFIIGNIVVVVENFETVINFGIVVHGIEFLLGQTTFATILLLLVLFFISTIYFLF